MRITISGKNIDITEGLRSAIEEKLSKLDKYFYKDTDASVTLSVEKNRQKINRRMGVVFGQKTQLWWDIPLIETFKILKSIYEVPDKEYEERFEYLCDLLDMKPFITQTVRSLSLGQRMRADFAAALIHSPKIVYLDEPTIGLDVLVKDKIRSAIKELNRKYKTDICKRIRYDSATLYG